jgi:23S rRNA (uracil1939-C5)-methyltransferase
LILPDVLPILGSPKTKFYRNKLEYGFSNKKWLTFEEVAAKVNYDQMNAVGFHIPGAFDKILPIEKCWLMDDLHNEIRNAIRDYGFEHQLTFFDLRAQHGLLRNLMFRNSNTGGLMVLIQFCIEDDNEKSQAEDLMRYIADNFPQITSFLYVDNHKCNDTIADQDVHVFKGNDYVMEEMDGLNFKVGPKSFYQTNTDQAFELYKTVRTFAGLTGNELVYDLYTGTGTIANFVSRGARQVIGIEYVPEAILDAQNNSAINGITNTLFYAGDMKDILNKEFIAHHGKPDVIITDPPRAGMHTDVITTLLFAFPERIVYVSCNPASQARDLALMDEQYEIKAVQPVDMFPHTQHVENVVLLQKRKHVEV